MATIDPALLTASADVEFASNAGNTLSARAVDPSDRSVLDGWLEAVGRGFLGGETNERQRDAFAGRADQARHVGIWDSTAPVPEVPVATLSAWTSTLTVPGGSVPGYAISSVTVAPTHRRRGLLRSLLTSELRLAAAHGHPLAMLTVSESSIYGRFGFAPAVFMADVEISPRRAGWIGPAPRGRVDFVTRQQGRDIVQGVDDRARATAPGEPTRPKVGWDRMFGVTPDAEKADQLRVVRYTSPEGSVDGIAVYRVRENEADFAESSVDIDQVIAATDDAYVALWHFFLSMDLIGTIRAGLLSQDEPLWWMIADRRAAKVTVRDHEYLRILDVPAALTARRYEVADRIALRVEDPLGIAGGTFVLATDDEGTATVEAVDALTDGVPVVDLGVAELSAALLGGVSLATLARAGRVTAEDPERIARLFRAVTAPTLSYWY